MDKVITIDGYSACGKSTVASYLVSQLNAVHIDSGLIFRVASYLFSKNRERYNQFINGSECSRYFIKDGCISTKTNLSSIHLKSEDVGVLASNFGRNKQNQLQLISVQKKLIEEYRIQYEPEYIILTGRNCGSSVFPNAAVKFFLTASVKVRSSRRYNQIIATDANAKLGEIERQILFRDLQDANRPFGKLTIPKDSILIDTANYTVNELSHFIRDKISKISK